MSKFIREDSLNHEIGELFNQANELIRIVSPYIKLHQKYRDILRSKLKDPNIQVIVLFGKNDGDIYKSISPDDLDFFSGFLNIEIRYEPRLHAKYYANEYTSIVASMNLYDFSQNNNIEVGVKLETPRIKIGGGGDLEAFDYFEQVIERSELLFKKEPQYSKGFLSFGKEFTGSIITENNLSKYIKGEKVKKAPIVETVKGFCIRCQTEIPLNPKKPFCDKHQESWNKYKNVDYSEKYCHICGMQHESSFIKPTCYTCYRENKQKLNF